MKKRITAFALSLCLLLGSTLLPQATAADETMVSVLGALGIMNGDANGNLNLSAPLTRAQFAKILVCASSVKDQVSSVSNVSPFRDVPYTHWAASFIKTAVENGWLTGYLDGSYRPENHLTLEEAVTAVLKLLGYQSTDISGSYPYGQLALYRSLGLNKGISAAAGTTLTREQCMTLIYNLLTTKTKDSDQYYLESLGYKVTSSGSVDYTSLLSDSMEGPIVVTSSLSDAGIPFSLSGATFYRNGVLCTSGDIARYDVLYYVSSLKTV